MMISSTLYAPGNRVVIRDAEWIVRNVTNTHNNYTILDVVGLSEIVKDRDSKFVVQLEKKITILDPLDTEFVTDQSPGYRNSRLYIESLLRQRTPKDDKLYIGTKAAIDQVAFQAEPAALALKQFRQRILIADAVGLGKTIECGILLSELIKRGRGKRILVLAVKSMLTQFQKELWTRFTIPLVRLDSTGIQKVKQHIPSGHNPFLYFDKSIISIDTLKRESEYRHYLEKSWWDIIVIDEAHNVAERGTHSMRSKLAKMIARRSDTLIMLSATPHDGKRESFASIMNMLDPTAIADPSNYGPEDIRGLFIRRFKKDIKHQVMNKFQEREIEKHSVQASDQEEAIYQILVDLNFKRIDQSSRKGSMLFKTTLEKSLFSSPDACLLTCRNRINRLKSEDLSEYWDDVEQLELLESALVQMDAKSFSKYQFLINFLQNNTWKWNRKDPHDRLVIFTERIETLKFLQKQLQLDLKLKDSEFAVLYGSMADTDIQQTVERFGNKQDSLRLIIASDVASEGINLHYQCHRMIHFDIPWSLMVFQQRNGRIDRYGQDEIPLIQYILTDSENEKIHGDKRILELLVEKDQQVHESIGDPSEFTGKYTVDEEELQTAQAMGTTQGAELLEQLYEQQAEHDPMADFMESLFEAADEAEIKEAKISSLYENDYSFLRDGINFLQSQHPLRAEFYDDGQTLELERPKNFKVIEKQLPSEIIPGKDASYILTSDVDKVMGEMERCRREEQIWPQISLLWELNPLVQWINDRLVTAFGRNQAPCVFVPEIRGNEDTLFFMSGLIPNMKGQSVVEDWFAVGFQGEQVMGILSLEEVIFSTGIGSKVLPNAAQKTDDKIDRKLVSEALSAAKTHILALRKQFIDKTNPQLIEQFDRLKGLQKKQIEFLFTSERQTEKKKSQQYTIEKTFDEYKQWIQETLRCSNTPYLRIIAIIQEVK